MAAQNPTAPLNGHKAGADDDELEDAEIAGDEDGFDDDDMMDKMSSSPSIADGRTCLQWVVLCSNVGQRILILRWFTRCIRSMRRSRARPTPAKASTWCC